MEPSFYVKCNRHQERMVEKLESGRIVPYCLNCIADSEISLQKAEYSKQLEEYNHCTLVVREVSKPFLIVLGIAMILGGLYEGGLYSAAYGVGGILAFIFLWSLWRNPLDPKLFRKPKRYRKPNEPSSYKSVMEDLVVEAERETRKVERFKDHCLRISS